MDRRAFTGVVSASITGLVLHNRESLQRSGEGLPLAYPEVAAAGADIMLTVGRNADVPTAESLADTLLQSAVLTVQGDLEGAGSLLREFESLAEESVSRYRAYASEILQIPEIDTLFSGIPAFLRLALTRIQETQSLVVDTVPTEEVRCLIGCLQELRPCFDNVWIYALKCLFPSIRARPLGPKGVLAAFVVCLLKDLPDLAGEILQECGPDLGSCMRNCMIGNM